MWPPRSRGSLGEQPGEQLGEQPGRYVFIFSADFLFVYLFFFILEELLAIFEKPKTLERNESRARPNPSRHPSQIGLSLGAFLLTICLRISRV